MMANLKKLRMERNLTQAQLGEILGVQGQTVLNWENDLSSPCLDLVIKIAHFFNVSVSYLIGEEDYYTPADYAAELLISFTPEEIRKIVVDKMRSK